jgi:hypothetical protein
MDGMWIVRLRVGSSVVDKIPASFYGRLLGDLAMVVENDAAVEEKGPGRVRERQRSGVAVGFQKPKPGTLATALAVARSQRSEDPSGEKIAAENSWAVYRPVTRPVNHWADFGPACIY